MAIGNNLKIALNEHNMTVAELSRKTGISTNTYYAMIRRDTKKINPNILDQICNHTDITIYELIGTDSQYIKELKESGFNTEAQEVGSYLLNQIQNDELLKKINENYFKLNNAGKLAAYQRVSELVEITWFNATITPDIEKKTEKNIDELINTIDIYADFNRKFRIDTDKKAKK